MSSSVSELSDEDCESARLVVTGQGWTHVRMSSEVALRGCRAGVTNFESSKHIQNQNSCKQVQHSAHIQTTSPGPTQKTLPLNAQKVTATRGSNHSTFRLRPAGVRVGGSFSDKVPRSSAEVRRVFIHDIKEVEGVGQ